MVLEILEILRLKSGMNRGRGGVCVLFFQFHSVSTKKSGLCTTFQRSYLWQWWQWWLLVSLKYRQKPEFLDSQSLLFFYKLSSCFSECRYVSAQQSILNVVPYILPVVAFRILDPKTAEPSEEVRFNLAVLFHRLWKRFDCIDRVLREVTLTREHQLCPNFPVLSWIWPRMYDAQTHINFITLTPQLMTVSCLVAILPLV